RSERSSQSSAIPRRAASVGKKLVIKATQRTCVIILLSLRSPCRGGKHERASCNGQSFSAHQNWRESYLYPQLDERRRSASHVEQMPRVSYCKAQQWQRDHDLAGTSFLRSTRRA